MGGNTNLGYLVTSGVLNQKDDGYSGRMKSNTTSVTHPNTARTRLWERKLDTALKTIVCVGKRTSAFEGRLLDSLKNVGEKQGEEKMEKEEKLAAAAAIVDAAEKRVLGMLVQIDRAKAGILRAEKSAIREDAIQNVAIAKRKLLELENDAACLLGRVGKMRETL